MREFVGDWFQLKTRDCGSSNTRCHKCKKDKLYGEPKHDIRLMNGEWANGFWEYNICDRCLVDKFQSMKNVFDVCCRIIEMTGRNTAETLVGDLLERTGLVGYDKLFGGRNNE